MCANNQWDSRLQEAMSNQLNRQIVDSLDTESLSFSQLMDRVRFVGSSAQFRHHLKRLEGFIEVDPETKKYFLTYRGRSLLSVISDFRNWVTMENSRVRYIEQLNVGDHAFAVYGDEDFKRNVAFPFLKIGLARNNAVVYLVSEEKLDSELSELKKYGLQVGELPKDALTVMSNFEWYLQRGRAEAKTIMTNGLRLLEKKKKAGFAGIFAAGEMATFIDNGLGRELLEYEEGLGRQFTTDASALCLYNDRVFEEVKVSRIFACHGHVISEEYAGKTFARGP